MRRSSAFSERGELIMLTAYHNSEGGDKKFMQMSGMTAPLQGANQGASVHLAVVVERHLLDGNNP